MVGLLDFLWNPQTDPGVSADNASSIDPSAFVGAPVDDEKKKKGPVQGSIPGITSAVASNGAGLWAPGGFGGGDTTLATSQPAQDINGKPLDEPAVESPQTSARSDASPGAPLDITSNAAHLDNNAVPISDPQAGHFWTQEGMVTVRSVDGRLKATHIGGSLPRALAMQMLGELEEARLGNQMYTSLPSRERN